MLQIVLNAAVEQRQEGSGGFSLSTATDQAVWATVVLGAGHWVTLHSLCCSPPVELVDPLVEHPAEVHARPAGLRRRCQQRQGLREVVHEQQGGVLGYSTQVTLGPASEGEQGSETGVNGSTSYPCHAGVAYLAGGCGWQAMASGCQWQPHPEELRRVVTSGGSGAPLSHYLQPGEESVAPSANYGSM